MDLCVCECVCTCWSNAFEGPGPCWGPAGQEHVGVCETWCVSACQQEGQRSRRSPVRESSQSRWLTSRCGSDSAAYPPPHLQTLNKDERRDTDSTVLLKCHILFFLIASLLGLECLCHVWKLNRFHPILQLDILFIAKAETEILMVMTVESVLVG